MRHVHVMDIRPDVVTRTGVIQPYAIREIPPGMVARHSVAAFEDMASGGSARIATEIQPEEFVRRARLVAVAMAQGKRMPAGTSQKLLDAANMIRQGRPFIVRSAGRETRVVARGRQGLSGGLGRVYVPRVGRRQHIAPATSWRGRRQRASMTSPAGRPRWTSRGWTY